MFHRFSSLIISILLLTFQPASSADNVKDPNYKPCYVPGTTGLPSLDNIPSVADLTASFAARKEERLKQEAEKKEAERRVSTAQRCRKIKHYTNMMLPRGSISDKTPLPINGRLTWKLSKHLANMFTFEGLLFYCLKVNKKISIGRSYILRSPLQIRIMCCSLIAIGL